MTQKYDNKLDTIKNNSRTASSLENLNKLDIGPKGGGNRNSSISSTSSTPNPQAADYGNLRAFILSNFEYIFDIILYLKTVKS